MKRKMTVGNVGTTVRDGNECKRTMMEKKTVMAGVW